MSVLFHKKYRYLQIYEEKYKGDWAVVFHDDDELFLWYGWQTKGV